MWRPRGVEDLVRRPRTAADGGNREGALRRAGRASSGAAIALCGSTFRPRRRSQGQMASSPRPTRTVATLSGTVVLALTAIGLAVAAPGSGATARAEVSAATGAMRVANSRAGQALFNVAAAQPGETVS